MKRKFLLTILITIFTLLISVGGAIWLIPETTIQVAEKLGAPIKREIPVASKDYVIELYYGESQTLAPPTMQFDGKTIGGTWSYTIDGDVKSGITTSSLTASGTASSSDSTVACDQTIKATFTPNTNFIFKYRPVTIDVTAKMKVVAYHGSNYYTTVYDAVTAANAVTSGTQTVVVIPNLGHSVIVKENITLNSNVKLNIPFSTSDTSDNDISDTRIKELSKLSLADANANSVATNRVTLLSLKNSADITISSGAELYLGGEFSTKGVMGKYAEINLNEGSNITCSGKFYCYGYVKENANNAKHGNQTNYQTYYNNSYDSERYVQITATGTVKTAIGIYDAKALTDLTNLNSVGIFPFALFDFPNLQTYVEVIAGGKFLVQTHVVATASTGDQVVNQPATIISANESASVFYLTSGSLAVEYCPNNVSYTSTTATTRIYLNGTVNQGSLSVKVSVVTIDTTDSFLPISYKLNIFVNENATFSTSSQKVKFLPGSSVKINSGGKMEIDKDVIFYENAEYSKISSYPSGKGDATLVNNGTLTVTDKGSIGAFIQTEATDNTAILNFSACTSSSAFTVTSTEGKDATLVTRTSEGYFEDTSEEGKSLYQFVAGSTITSSENSTQCWTGSRNATQKLTLQLEEKDYQYKIFSYQVFTADDANESAQTEITSGVTSTIPTGGTSFDIPNGKYVKILVTRHASATLTSATRNGENLSTSTWYLVDSDMTVNIVPNEGVKISVETYASEANSSSGDDPMSGNNYTTFTIYESNSATGTFTQIATRKGIGTVEKGTGLVAYIVKNWYFKVTTEVDSLANLGVKGELDTANFKMTKDDGTSDSFTADKAYKAGENYVVSCPRKLKSSGSSSCIAAGTLITLADGTQKKVEDVVETDILLVFDHETGKYVESAITFIERDGWDYYNVINLEFSNGTKTRLIYEHGLFDLTLNKYVYIDESNYQSFVGHTFAIMSENGNAYETVTLEKAYITNEYTGCFSLVTMYHLNYFIDGLFSMPGGISGLFNYFEYGEGLKYDEEQMQADIEKYGLFTYEDFEDLIPYEIYEYAFPAKYYKISIAKGLMTWDDILNMIEIYLVKNGVM